MIREEDWKYVYYVDHPSQLFNLHDDPLELTNLAQNVDYRDVLAQMDTTLREIVDPEREHQRAVYHQQQRHQRLGATKLFE